MDEQNNVTFDSERVLKKEKQKRILIPIACIVAAILLVLLIAWIVNKLNSTKYESNQDLQFTYSWIEESNGTIRLTIDRVGASDYEWVYAGEESPVLSVGKPHQSKDKTEFTLKPLTAGRKALDFYLEHKTNKDHICELSVLAEVIDEDGKLKLSFISTDSVVKPTAQSGGESFGYPYTIYMNANDNLIVSVQDPAYFSSGGGSSAPEETSSSESSPASSEETSDSSEIDPSQKPMEEMNQLEAMTYLSEEEYFIWLEMYLDQFDSSTNSMTDEELSQWFAEIENKTGPYHTEEPASENNGEEIPEDMSEDTTEAAMVSYDWDAISSDEEILRILGVIYEDSSVDAYMRAAGKGGTCQVEVFSPSARIKITINFEVNESGEVKILSHNIDTYVPTPVPESEDEE